jgi:GNAT superfamily N-acetyltransferase
VTFPWLEPPSAAGLEWLPFDDRTRPEFARTILASYQDSLDCPELTGIRPIDDILAAHQAAGRFDPALWELALVDGEPSGCLLLAQHVHTPLVEVVYTGVVPAWRRRGVGGWLLRRAVEQGRAVRARRLSVVVDSRNAPAKRLYQRFAFTPVTHRDAFWYRFTP